VFQNIFVVNSVFIFAFPLFLMIYCWLGKKERKHYFHIFLMGTVTILWVIFLLYEKTCKTKECLEWERESTGFVLALMELSPLFLLIILIPWYIIIFMNIKNDNRKT